VTRNKDGLARVRAWWFRRQGLAARTPPTRVADALRLSGWVTTSGSTNVYLSLRARMRGLSREAVERAVMDGTEVMEVPGAHARPPSLVPRDEAAIALRLHHASYAKHAAAYFKRGDFSEAAVKAVAAQVCQALDEGPLSTAGIRALVTHRDAAALLVAALVDLSVRGVIRRFPSDGRLDSSKYVYELRHPDDRPDLEGEGDETSVVTAATRLFLHRHGPASVDEIAAWAPLTKGVVRKALGALGAEPVAIDGWTDDAWLLPDDIGAWKTFAAEETRVVFLPYRDPFVSLRQPPAVLTGNPRARVLTAASKPLALAAASTVMHHAIVAGGELVGVWDYDPRKARIVSRVWGTNKGLGGRVAEAAADTESFIQRQLGDCKLSAVDPDDRRAKRLAFVSKG
jgi:hypothetical protein